MKNTKAYGAEIQDELRETAPEYEKWRRRLFIMNCVIAAGVFLLEIGVNIILFVQGKVNPDIVYHLMRYLVVPSGLVFLAVLFDGIMMRCFPNKDWLLNYIMVLTVVFMCTVVAVTHYVFPITMTAFVIPVLMSVVFGNNRMTAATAASCSVCVILTGIWRNIDGTDTDRYYVVQEVVISLGIIFMSLIVAEIVNSLITEQNHRLLDALRKEKRSQQEAEAANMAKSSFLANMSHEIRTPINAVLGMDEMILRESSDESILSYAANIQSAGHSLLSVINDILDLSKIESGRLELLTAEYSTQQLMNDCYSMMIMRAEKKDLLLEIKNDPQLPAKLAGDEVRLRQVILNLLTNAVKYTSAGEVTMRVDFKHTAENEIMLKISVRDTGMGISQENQQNLFKAFRRLDEMTNRHIEGTGLGLNITKHLTEMMGGTIAVRSTLGSGSEFTVEIPQRVVSYEPVGVFIENRRAASGQKEEYHERFRAPGARILVVDDVKLNIDVIKGLLRLTQIRTESAYSGRECLGLVSRTHYDLIFMDHLMPDMDGIETLKQLRAQDGSPNAGTPVIALTANVMVGAREKYAACGFTDYLAKPVQSDRLESVLLEYLPRELILPITPGSETHEAASGARELPELNAAAGINCCCGDEKLFRRIIGMADMTSRAESLEKALDSSDWKEYAQTCTELCSAAAAVGAERLAQSAQYAADLLAAGNIAELRSHERRLISHCRSFDEAAAAYIQKYTENGEKY